MKSVEENLKSIMIVLSIFFTVLLCWDEQVCAATTGSIPCSEGSVTWSLSDEGELVFSGNGTTAVYGRYAYDWTDYWDECGLNKEDVSSVRVEEGSKIYLDTCFNLFYKFTVCKSIDMTGFDTTKVGDMYRMFGDCYVLKNLDISAVDTTNVDDMGWMFSFCCSLDSLDLSGFNTSNVQFMESMFRNCSKLTSVDLSSFDTSKVKWMNHMFYCCINLTDIDVSHFDTSKVDDIENMFSVCESLKVLDISNFDLSNVDESFVFTISCNSLEKFVSSKNTRQYKLITADGDRWFDKDMNFYLETQALTLNPKTTVYKVKDSYNINYVYEGKLMNCPDTYVVADGLSQLGTVELEHYTFGGWYADAQYKTAVTSIEKGTLGDVTLYAKMIPNTYRITYMNTERAINTEGLLYEYTYGSAYKLPVLKGGAYAFDGWYLNKELTNKIDSITATTGGNLTLYAKWTYTLDVAENTAAITDETILTTKNDNDIAGSSFVMIQARADKTAKNSIRLKWNKVKNADGYKIYGNKCGKKNSYKLMKTITNGKKTTYTQRKLKKGTYYKYIVRAYKVIDGQEVTLAASKTIHATTTGGKYGNAKSVKIKTDKKMKSKKGSYTLTIKKNKKYTIKASEVKQSQKINKHRKIAFESSNTNIATVSKKGVVKGKKKGTCYIYAYAQNGAYKKIKVKVQ